MSFVLLCRLRVCIVVVWLRGSLLMHAAEGFFGERLLERVLVAFVVPHVFMPRGNTAGIIGTKTQTNRIYIQFQLDRRLTTEDVAPLYHLRLPRQILRTFRVGCPAELHLFPLSLGNVFNGGVGPHYRVSFEMRSTGRPFFDGDGEAAQAGLLLVREEDFGWEPYLLDLSLSLP